MGRDAASVPSFNYSPGLREAEVRWSADALDRWLADPRKFALGTRMMVRVLDPATRRDIIAFLKALEAQVNTATSPTVSR